MMSSSLWAPLGVPMLPGAFCWNGMHLGPSFVHGESVDLTMKPWWILRYKLSIKHGNKATINMRRLKHMDHMDI